MWYILVNLQPIMDQVVPVKNTKIPYFQADNLSSARIKKMQSFIHINVSFNI